ncbi:cell wall biogenesis and architecture protein [Dimargaris cristalligena]|uniref:3-methyl-2-oxobutanoate hydroxymethyltransferase n=1 Tax=Dimargaris cristalligena TaxID=215637 RepID=A0A4P9ZQS3_9FUNG|nr:cell wall biogenesis and architecture protein [Dimargaris cristalligena]RKP34992.1 ketopantoate hydroxymethyltransferase-domain-containing protein [Dimargaris cristalligena]|eukprot:RKP34992.1 ketopantoate hydroxymethyltransferase-domain-containing protein [Dimargaris cristalligena]
MARLTSFPRCTASLRCHYPRLTPTLPVLHRAPGALPHQLLNPAVLCPAIQSRSYSSRPVTATSTEAEARKKVTVNTIASLYRKKSPITVLTAYDYPTGLLVDRGHCDICLVGDSLAMVALGLPNTSALTVDDMIYHSKAVARGCTAALRVVDMPTGSFQISPEEALRNAFRLMKEGEAEAVKLEGGAEMAETVKRITQAGIPVMGHIGLTPQHENALGGFRVQGKTAKKAEKILRDALALQEAGCFSMVVECVPSPVAETITSMLSVPTIGIGAGPKTSGQVLVTMDMFGVFDRFVPKFCKTYGDFGQSMTGAIEKFVQEVKDGSFPDPESHTYAMASPKEVEEWAIVVKNFKP